MFSSTTSILILSLTLFISNISATFSQGSVNLTRDYLIHYEGYSSTESFCKSFRKGCEVYNELLFSHHQLDCVFNQKGPNVRAFCGGLKRNLLGQLPSGESIDPHTAEMIYLVKGAKIVSGPIASTHTTPTTTKVKPTITHHSSHGASKSTSTPHHSTKPSTTTKHHHSTSTAKPSHHSGKTWPWGWSWPWSTSKKETLISTSSGSNSIVGGTEASKSVGSDKKHHHHHHNSTGATVECGSKGRRHHVKNRHAVKSE